MASVRPTANGKFELTIRNKLLPKRVFLTFDDKATAEQYGNQVDKMLRAGIVPSGLVVDKAKPQELLSVIVLDWIRSGAPAASDKDLLQLLAHEVGQLRISDLTYQWALDWVKNMKLVANYSPGTIRKRIGALSRCLDDFLRRRPELQLGNPLRLLPRGAATYNAQDAEQAIALDKKPKVDVVRDRRLKPGELGRILKALAGEKRDDRERPLDLPEADALRMLFLLIYHTGVRLREAYMLKASQINMRTRTLTIQSSKQWHGRIKFRDVPMRKELHAALTHYLGLREYAGDDRLFPWWDGDLASLKKTTGTLSARFNGLFAYAECDNLKEHDLRHEATCQWYELKDAQGRDMFRDKEIEKIMGWAPGSAQPSRYASFRAEDLAERLYL